MGQVKAGWKLELVTLLLIGKEAEHGKAIFVLLFLYRFHCLTFSLFSNPFIWPSSIASQN